MNIEKVVVDLGEVMKMQIPINKEKQKQRQKVRQSKRERREARNRPKT